MVGTFDRKNSVLVKKCLCFKNSGSRPDICSCLYCWFQVCSFVEFSQILKNLLTWAGKSVIFVRDNKKRRLSEAGTSESLHSQSVELRVTVKIFYTVLTGVARGYGYGRGKKISDADWVFNLIRVFLLSHLKKKVGEKKCLVAW